jgi:hypothetical protein
MDYNSQRKTLVLPEYGRHIHKMVEHAKTIEDREERSKCAYSIVSVMGNLFPHLRDVSDFKHKLWDHLAMMSGFELDIDYPYEVPKEYSFNSVPEKVPYNDYAMRYKHYGRIIEQMIAKAIVMEDGELKEHLISLIVTQMRKSLLNWNRDNATDERVLQDLKKLSKGELVATPKHFMQSEAREPQANRMRKKHFPRKHREQ